MDQYSYDASQEQSNIISQIDESSEFETEKQQKVVQDNTNQNNNNNITRFNTSSLSDTQQLISSQSYSMDEPETHVKNKGCRESFCCLCFKVNYELNKREIHSFNNLKFLSNDMFDIFRQDHKRLLCNLYNIIREENLDENNIESEYWVKIGFQSKNPEGDFRGGGVMSLKNMIHYVNKNYDLVIKMIHPSNNFFFACSSINLTFFLKKYFHLANFLELKDHNQYCDRKTLKLFCQYQADDDMAFFQIHEMLLTDLFENCWLRLIQIRANKHIDTSLLDFSIALNALKNKFKLYCSKQSLNTEFKQFKQNFQLQDTIFNENINYNEQ